MLVGKRDGVADLQGTGEVRRFIGLEQIDGSHQRDVGGIDVAEDLRLGGIAETLASGDIELGLQFLALILIEDSQWESHTHANVKRVAQLAAEIDAEGRVGGSVRLGKLMISLRLIDSFDGGAEVWARSESDSPKIFDSVDIAGKVEGSVDVELIHGRPVVQHLKAA